MVRLATRGGIVGDLIVDRVARRSRKSGYFFRFLRGAAANDVQAK
jgi:hypothetical protein